MDERLLVHGVKNHEVQYAVHIVIPAVGRIHVVLPCVDIRSSLGKLYIDGLGDLKWALSTMAML